MQDKVTVPPPDTPWVLSKNVLNEAGLSGNLHLLAPGAEMNVDGASPGPLVMFVVAGPVTVSCGAKNFILQTENTLHLPPGSKYGLRNRETSPVKVLVLTLPAPRPPRPADNLAALLA
jgi:Uncharacterized protein, possibly involved in glyoxylate utilization